MIKWNATHAAPDSSSRAQNHSIDSRDHVADVMDWSSAKNVPLGRSDAVYARLEAFGLIRFFEC